MSYLSETQCRVCKSRKNRYLFQKKGYTIVKCISCGLRYVLNNLEPDFLIKLYSQKYFTDPNNSGYGDYFFEKEYLKRTASKRLKKIRQFKSDGRRLLEVGSGPGYFLSVARKEYNVTGVELSAYASQYAKEYMGLDVFNGTIQEAHFGQSTFDIVTMWDVIEHVADPLSIMKEVNRVMRPSGGLVLTTGDVSSVLCRLQGKRWRLYDPPYHLSYFSRSTICRLLESAGFTVKRIEHTWENHSLRYICYALCDYYDKKIFRVLKEITQRTKLGNFSIHLTGFDIMTVYAFKKGE